MTVESIPNVSTISPETVTENLTENNTTSETPVSTPKPSPAQDLRKIQTLLVMGQFPGQAAPEICKAYQLLEKMAVQIETESNVSK